MNVSPGEVKNHLLGPKEKLLWMIVVVVGR